MFQLYLNLLLWCFPYAENMQDIEGESIQGKTYFRLQHGICKSFAYILCPDFNTATWKSYQVWYEHRRSRNEAKHVSHVCGQGWDRMAD